jgi:formylglycine-generating enzyme required for sulfatase activity
VIDAGGFGIDALEATRGDYLRFLSDAADVSLQSPQCQWNTTFEPDPSAGCTDVADAMKAGFPITCVDWCDAAAFCAWAGKRLCGRRGGGTLGESGVNDPAASEWYAACSADGALAFPYGDSFVPETCNALGSPNGGMFTGAGWYVGCEGGYPGLFDMVGNVEEWEDACTIGPDPAADNCFLRGGAFWSDETVAVCASNFERSPDRSATSDDWGFRCCKDL